MGLLSLVVAVVFCSVVSGQHLNRLAFQVDARQKECYFVEVPKEEVGEVTLEVSVIKGGLLDILIEVSDPSQQKIFSRMFFEGKGPNEMKFLAERGGDYEVCFNNEMARWTSKVVAMRVILSKRHTGSPAKPEDIDPIEQKLQKLESTLEMVMKEQAHFKDREAAHSGALRVTHNKITYYSIFESAVLVTLSLTQIYFVRKWFDNPSTRTRV